MIVSRRRNDSGRFESEDLAAHFWARVDRRGADECWEWQGYRNPKGYGRFHSTTGVLAAHRFAYETLRGPIPAGLQLDHLCRNPSCVNPAHLEPVTLRENLLRGDTITASNAAKTHCLRGHPFSPENTHVARGERACRTCWRERKAEAKRKRTEAML